MSGACVLVASLLLMGCVTADFVAPSVIAPLTESSQQYQLGVWSFLLFVVVGVAGFYFVASIDYSGDTLLTVDAAQHEHST